MRLSIPGLPGVYYNTDGESTALTVAFTAAGRRAPKPQGYALQMIPHLWSFDVDLQEVPRDHPIQYLHPEGAQSIQELARDDGIREVGDQFDQVLRFVWAVNDQTESAARRLVGSPDAEDGVVIEIEEGDVTVDGEQLDEGDGEFDVQETDSSAGAFGADGADETNEDDGPIHIDVEDADSDDDSDDAEFGGGEFDAGEDGDSERDPDEF